MNNECINHEFLINKLTKRVKFISDIFLFLSLLNITDMSNLGDLLYLSLQNLAEHFCNFPGNLCGIDYPQASMMVHIARDLLHNPPLKKFRYL